MRLRSSIRAGLVALLLLPGLTYAVPIDLRESTGLTTPLGGVAGTGQAKVTPYNSAGTELTDPCAGAKTAVPIDIVTATTTQLVAASAANKVYVCSINLGPTSAADNVALVEDDTSACASPTAGMAGGVTAGEGWNFPANGGLTFGNGLGTVAVTAAVNRYVCLITSSTAQLSGVITYVLAP